jgi:tetratricopeptide (TPR) repeat protein
MCSAVRALGLRVMIVALAVAAFAVVPPRRAAVAAEGAPFWERATNPERERFERLFTEAEGLVASGEGAPVRAGLPSDKLARAEALLREALALRPDEFRALFLLADVQSLAGRPAAAVATLERALPRAQLPSEEAACWFRLGVERSKLGRYAEAVADYDRQVALGESDGTVYANSAEILMALGRLGEAEDRYREAIRVDEQSLDRRSREHGLALSYYGLGVALDRDEQPIAAREMIARALALDPTQANLTIAQQPGSDVFFIPDGDVFYYVGLAAEVAGHSDDAEAAFREFLSRLPASRYARRARAHLEGRAAGGPAAGAAGRSPVSGGSALRIVATGTLFARGGAPAPLVDAAFRAQPRLLDACLDRAAAAGVRDSVRFAVELDLDARGAVTRATVKAPAPLDAGFARCAEAAIKDGLRLSRPPRARPSHARVEMILAVANKDAPGL